MIRAAAGRKQPGQALVIAALAMVAVVGGLAMVIDTGMFFVIQRQLHAAADAGALAGAWHDPICLQPAVGCLGPAGSAATVAQQVAQANAERIRPLCPGGITIPPPGTGTQLIRPRNVNTIVVTVQCEAGFSFGRILGLTTQHISVSAAAAIGDRDASGDMTDFTSGATPPPNGRIARLIE